MPFPAFFTENKRKERSRSQTTGILWPFTSLTKKKIHSGRADLCTFKSGVLTVEASVILPVFLLAMIMLIGVLDICRVQITGQARLAEKAKTLSMYAYSVEEYYPGNMVDLYETKRYQLPVTLFPFPGIPVALRARVHTWTGREQTTGEAGDEVGEGDIMVYVTLEGGVYHTNAACTYLDLSIHTADKGELEHMRNDYGSKYHSCEKCGGHSSSGVYYVTEKGDKYHSSYSCSGLKRTVRLVRKSDLSGMHMCSRCQKT